MPPAVLALSLGASLARQGPLSRGSGARAGLQPSPPTRVLPALGQQPPPARAGWPFDKAELGSRESLSVSRE